MAQDEPVGKCKRGFESSWQNRRQLRGVADGAFTGHEFHNWASLLSI
jgi:hypothetical protein